MGLGFRCCGRAVSLTRLVDRGARCQNKSMSHPQWLAWARRLQALSQSGLAYCRDRFDIERYHELREIAA